MRPIGPPPRVRTGRSRILRPALLLTAGTVLFLAAGRAQALPILEFHVRFGVSGSIAYPAAGGGLVGTGIRVTEFDAKDTRANADVGLRCVDCFLDFTTGNFTGSGEFPWEFAPGGSIVITGGLTSTDPAVPFSIPSGSTLFSGRFHLRTIILGEGVGKLAFATGFEGMHHPALLAFLGFPQDDPFRGFFHIGFRVPAPAPPVGGTFASRRIDGGDIVTTPVPEPATLVLLGSGLLAAGVLRHRRTRS